jgi:O-antigen ligase
LRFKIGVLPSTFLEVMIWIIAGVWFIKIAIPKIKKEGLLSLIPSSFYWPFFLFLLASSLAIASSVNLKAGLGLGRAYLLEPLLIFIIFASTLKSTKDIKKIILALGCLTVFLSLFSLLQYFDFLPIPPPYGTQIPKRATAVFPFPTAVGKFVGPLIGFLWPFVLLKTKKEKKLKYWSWLFIIFGLISLFTSFTRGAILGVVVSLVVISLFSPYRRWLWGSLLTISLLSFIFVPFIRKEIISVIKIKDVATDVRVVMWRGALRIIKHHPIFGSGFGGFPTLYAKYKLPQHIEFFPNPDNLILTLWIEMGISGLVVFMLILGRLIYLSVKLLKRGEEIEQKIALGTIGTIVALFIHGLVDTPYFKNDLAVQFWILVSFLIILLEQKFTFSLEKR